MLFRPADLEGIAAGAITLQFRRWERARVLVGSRLRTPIGVLEIDAVEVVERPTDEDARAAGYDDAEHVLASFAKRKGALHRVALHLAGPDPRIALRESPPDAAVFARPGADGRVDVRGAAGDRGAPRACARPTWRQSFGRETAPFKRDVRKLKELGLTESLEIGYRISPRGQAVLDVKNVSPDSH